MPSTMPPELIRCACCGEPLTSYEINFYIRRITETGRAGFEWLCAKCTPKAEESK